MKKHPRLKKTLIILALVIGICVIGVFVVYPLCHYFSVRDMTDDANAPEIASEVENIDFNNDNGLLYVNDEIIIMTREGVARAGVEDLAEEFDAEIVSTMEDIGFWQIRFRDAMTYDELNKILKKIKRSEIVEDAYFNTVYEIDPDEDEEEIAPAKPYFPDDPWDGDAKDWDTDVPRGSNWGMEAIQAPGAWGYLDEMAEVNIGLIDTMVDIGHEDIALEASFVTLTEDSSKTYDASNWTPADHGTHVAGIMAGNYDNGNGISGVMGGKGNLYYSAAYTLKNGKIVGDYYTAYNYLAAIKALADRNVKVINISQNTSRLIGFAASRGNKNAINHLQNAADMAGKGLQRMIENGDEFVICVAAGNSNDTVYYKSKKSTYGYKENWFWPWDFFMGDSGDSDAKYNNFLNLIDIEDVKSRIIVVGSIGIDQKKSGSDETRYHYSRFSNIGDRVDVVAPGEYIYSSVINDYDYMSGTSMASPHVSGVAGLIFACNPELSGADVKRILLASTTGRFYYADGYSGLINAETAVENALQTREHSINQVIKTDTDEGLDVCFVVDTTGSMEDDIANAKENMNEILGELSAKSENFRVAIIDYRDFADRAQPYDYPSMLRLDFSQDIDEITSAINALDLGDGGDDNETVYSGLMAAAELGWRPEAQKVIIVLGDAPPLDPEPYTGYTFDSVVAVLYNADISLFSEPSVSVDMPDYEGLAGDAADSMIKVFTIGTDASTAAEDFFNQISEATGGSYTGVDSASEVSDAIISTIEQIEIIPTKTVKVAFDKDYSGETVELYQDGDFVFEVTLDENGRQELENMALERYDWSIPRLLASGSIKIRENGEQAKILYDDSPWYAFAVSLWQRERVSVILYGVLGVIALAAVIVFIRKIKRRSKKPQPVQNRLICTRCGFENNSLDRFCIQCGARIDTGNSSGKK
jgi:Subtilisin-like serine proteases